MSFDVDTIAQLGKFLQVLFTDQHRGTLFLCGGARVEGKVPRWRDTPYDLARIPLERVAIDAWRRGQREDCFFSCALFAGQQRVEAQAVTYPFLYADLDTGTLTANVPRPTIILESSPGRRQAFWKLHKPTTREIATSLNRRIAAACSADMSGWDATQVLRMPGLPNHKYDGACSRIEAMTDRTYDTEDFTPLPEIRAVAPADIELSGGADGMVAWRAAWPYLSRRMRALASGGDDSAYDHNASRGDHALMCALVNAGLTPDEAIAAFLVTPRGQRLPIRKTEERVAYLTELSVRKAVALVGTVIE